MLRGFGKQNTASSNQNGQILHPSRQIESSRNATNLSGSPPPYSHAVEQYEHVESPFPRPGMLRDDPNENCETFCGPCTRHRRYKTYNQQFHSMLAPLRCFECNVDRPRVFFDYVSRLAADAVPRRCIFHTSPFILCLHNQIEFGEWNEPLWKTSSSCTESPCDKWQLKFHNTKTSAERYRIVRTWSFEMIKLPCSEPWVRIAKLQSSEPWFKVPLKALRMHMGSHSDLFCPHMVACPDNFISNQFIEKCNIPGEDRILKICCPSCPTVITLSQPDPQCAVEIRFKQTADLDRIDLIIGEWANVLRLNLIGLGEDPELKYITWCLDSTCETSRFRERLAMFLRHAHTWMNMQGQYHFDGKAQLDYVMRQRRRQRG